MLLSALESIIAQVKKSFVPTGVEHDPRIPPVGRLKDATLVEIGDGEYAVEGVLEIFEPSDTAVPLDLSRKMVVKNHTKETLRIDYDRNYDNPEDLIVIKEIASQFGSKPEYSVKKAVDPISCLVIGGSFVLASLAGGFFKKMGSDAWDVLKKKLIKLLSHRKEGEKEKLLVFEFTVFTASQSMLVEAVLTNPTQADLDLFVNRGLAALDRFLPNLFSQEQPLAKAVFQLKGNDLVLDFLVRADCLPLKTKQPVIINLAETEPIISVGH